MIFYKSFNSISLVFIKSSKASSTLGLIFGLMISGSCSETDSSSTGSNKSFSRGSFSDSANSVSSLSSSSSGSTIKFFNFSPLLDLLFLSFFSFFSFLFFFFLNSKNQLPTIIARPTTDRRTINQTLLVFFFSIFCSLFVSSLSQSSFSGSQISSLVTTIV